MKILFEKDADYDHYKKYYYPLLIKHGFTWKLFPELTIYLDMKYPEWVGSINSNREHIRPDIPAIFVRMIDFDEWTAAGAPASEYQRVMNTHPSSLPHEIGHYFHIKYFGEDNSLLWQKACVLMKKEPSFDYQYDGNYAWKQSYEDFANYFEDCIEGRNEDEEFLSFVRDLACKSVKITPQEYLIQKDEEGNDRAWLPVRKVAEKLDRVVEYSEDTKDVWVFDLKEEDVC